jgi:hypothetical protein
MLGLQNNLATTPPPPPSKPTPIAAIIGGVVGGIALVAFVLFGVFWCRRSRRNRETSSESTPMIHMFVPQSAPSVQASLLPTPFTSEDPGPSGTQYPPIIPRREKDLKDQPPSQPPSQPPGQPPGQPPNQPPNQRPPAASPPATTSTSRTPVQPSTSNPSSQAHPTQADDAYIPTEVLMWQLNERLRAPQSWNDSEVPPGYGSQ